MRLCTAPASARASRPASPGADARSCASGSCILPFVEWPFSDPGGAADVSLMHPSLGSLARAARRARRVGLRQEAPDQAVGLLGALDLRDMAAALQHDLLGARQPLRDVP